MCNVTVYISAYVIVMWNKSSEWQGIENAGLWNEFINSHSTLKIENDNPNIFKYTDII